MITMEYGATTDKGLFLTLFDDFDTNVAVWFFDVVGFSTLSHRVAMNELEETLKNFEGIKAFNKAVDYVNSFINLPIFIESRFKLFFNKALYQAYIK